MRIRQIFSSYYGMPDKMESGLSLYERIIAASYEVERKIGKRKLKPPKFYKDRLFEIKNRLKEEIIKGKYPENVIRDYISSIPYQSDIFLTESLESGKANCVASASLFLSLAEMLDYNLFRNCFVGNLPKHILIRKRKKRNHENIDFGKTFPLSYYRGRYNAFPKTVNKENIISSIFTNGGYGCDSKDDKISLFEKSLKIDPTNIDLWLRIGKYYGDKGMTEKEIECYDGALKIDPKGMASVCKHNALIELSLKQKEK